MSSDTTPTPGRGSELDRLIAFEADLEERLAEARAEAARLVALARTAAEATRAGVEESWRAEAVTLTERLTRERDTELARLRSESEQRQGRVRALSPAESEALARRMLTRIVESPGQESPS